MKRHWLLAIVAANLVALVALVFVYPQWMVAPGALDAGHASLAKDCFACHAPLRGASADRCVACHTVADIGVRSTKGVVLEKRAVKTSLHQALRATDCMACHTDHAGPKLTHAARKPFSHEMLRPDAASKCQSCHQPPAGALHERIKGNCQQCHATKAWKPASFDHAKYFVLDRDHNVSCTTCHGGGDYKTYSCYGCHEHTVENVRRKHEKERIRGFDNCVKCHRSAHGDAEGRGDAPGAARGERE